MSLSENHASISPALTRPALTRPALTQPAWTYAALALLLIGTLASSQALAEAPDTDQPLWRATHGLLLTIAQAGKRLVAAGDRGIILLSDDQGATWTLSPSQTPALLTASVFTSPTQGWLVGQDSTILHTADAGAHWTSQHSEPGTDQALFSVTNLGASPSLGASPGGQHLVATGAYAQALETTDGAQWTKVKLPNLDEDYHLNCAIARGEDLLVTGEAGHAFVRHAGTWTPMPVPYDGSQFGCLAGADGAIYSFGLRGSLFVSTTATPAWTRIDTGEKRSLFGGTLMASGSLVLVGSNGLMLVYDPKDHKITKLAPVTGAALSGIVETTPGKLVAVGEDGIHQVDPAASAAASEATQ